MSTRQDIICPECGLICQAKIEHTFPWNTYIHRCEHCEYVIMESEWNPAPKPATNWWAYILVAVICLLMIIATLLKAEEIDQIFK